MNEKTKQLIQKIEAGQQALSFTALSRFLSSPYNFIRYKTEDFNRTPSMLEGLAAHSLCLEPQKFEDDFYIGKVIKDDSRQRLTVSNHKNAQIMADNVLRHPKWKGIISTARTVEVRDKITLDGFSFRRVLDIDGYDKIYDIKTMGAADITPRKFKWKVYDFNYHIQAAIYVAQYDNIADNILNIDTLPEFYWITVTKSDCVIMQAHKDFILAGFEKLQQALSDWNRCIDENAWMQGGEFFLHDEQLIIRP